MDILDELMMKVGQLESLVNQMIIDNMMNAANQQQGMVGGGVPVMPIVGGGTETPGCYDIGTTDAVQHTVTFERPYYSIGGKTYVGPTSVTAAGACIVAIRIGTGMTRTCSLVTFANVAALQIAQQDYAQYTIPLYQLDADLSVVCDFRTCMNASMGEF